MVNQGKRRKAAKTQRKAAGKQPKAARKQSSQSGSSKAKKTAGARTAKATDGRAEAATQTAAAAAGLPRPTARTRFTVAVAESDKLQRSVELERIERLAAYDAAIRDISLTEGLESAAASLRILAEGDSWFDYPLGSDVIDQVHTLLGVPIANLAHHGDEVRQMLSLKQRKEIEKRLRDGAPDGRKWDALLFSGGGNDIVGDELCIWLSSFSPGMSADQVLNLPRLDAVLTIVIAGYRDLIQIRDELSPDTRLFFHTYDLAHSTGKGVCGVGPWLKPSLDFRQVPVPLQTEVVKVMLQRFAGLLMPLHDPSRGIFVVDTQGTFPPLTTSAQINQWWANELHPTNKGFHAIATKVAGALRQAFPELPPDVESPGPTLILREKLESTASRPRPVSNYYLSQLTRGATPRVSGLESAEDTAATVDLSPSGVDERMSSLEDQWREVVAKFLDDDPEAHRLIKKIARDGRTALRVLGDQDEARLAVGETRAQLEVIVRMDGSRPSFMVRNGEVDLETSPVGSWGDALNASADLLQNAIACVGRIDVRTASQGFEGSGFLVAENLIVTNRHVLQEIATQTSPGNWSFKKDISIDFGHEFRARDTVNKRPMKRVVFAGSKPIDPISIDHGRLDIALIELQAAKPAQRLPLYLGLDKSPDWPQADQEIYILGYPGRPQTGSETPTLLEKLFKQTFGCKRLAPGVVTVTPANLPDSPRDWSTGHDATTLGGNSGSAVLVISREQIVAGLHYGGRRSEPRVNWAHVLGLVLDETDGVSPVTLREVLAKFGVQLVDRL